MARKNFGGQLIGAMKEALAYARGEKTGVRETEGLDVKGARERLGLSQGEFASACEISLPTLQKWEQGKRSPTGPARALIRIIAAEPEAAKRALKLGRAKPPKPAVSRAAAKSARTGRRATAR